MQRRGGFRHSNGDASGEAQCDEYNCSSADVHRLAQGHFEGSRGGGNVVTHLSSYTHFSSLSVHSSQQPKKGFVTFRWLFLPPLNM